MTYRYVSIQPSHGGGYDVFQKSFGIFYQGDYIKSWSSINFITKRVDREIAEIAAIKFAALKGLSYVPQDTNVITVIPILNKSFLVVEIQPDGEILGQGHILDRVSSITKARDIAQQRGLSFVFPPSAS